MPYFLAKLRARQLSSRGEHAAALALSRCRDPGILSKAGMHLAVMGQSAAQPPELALALASVGRIQESVNLVRRLPISRKIRPLLGKLAVKAPHEVLGLIKDGDMPDIRAYCHRVVGKPIAESTELSNFTRLLLAADKGDARSFEFYGRRIFTDVGLDSPEFDWTNFRIDINSAFYNASLKPVESPHMVSVILTSYNEEKYLATAVDSILAQTWKNIELILVDDGSTDRTHAIGEKLAAQDPRVRAFRLDENIGTWEAKNFGLNQARGAFVTMHDADDWSHPEKLARQLQPLLSDSKRMCSSSYMFRVAEATGLPFTRNAASFIRWNPSSLLYRKEVVNALGNYFSNILGGDCEFAGRIESMWGNSSHYRVTLPLSVGWQRDGSLSSKFRSNSRARHRIEHWEYWRKLHAAAHHSAAQGGLNIQRLIQLGF